VIYAHGETEDGRTAGEKDTINSVKSIQRYKCRPTSADIY